VALVREEVSFVTVALLLVLAGESKSKYEGGKRVALLCSVTFLRAGNKIKPRNFHSADTTLPHHTVCSLSRLTHT